jgi:hypothetical protein
MMVLPKQRSVVARSAEEQRVLFGADVTTPAPAPGIWIYDTADWRKPNDTEWRLIRLGLSPLGETHEVPQPSQ